MINDTNAKPTCSYIVNSFVATGIGYQCINGYFHFTALLCNYVLSSNHPYCHAGPQYNGTHQLQVFLETSFSSSQTRVLSYSDRFSKEKNNSLIFLTDIKEMCLDIVVILLIFCLRSKPASLYQPF